MVNCPDCGTENEESNKFCINCGQVLLDKDQEAEVSDPSQFRFVLVVFILIFGSAFGFIYLIGRDVPVPEGNIVLDFSEQGRKVTELQYSPDGEYLLTVSTDEIEASIIQVRESFSEDNIFQDTVEKELIQTANFSSSIREIVTGGTIIEDSGAETGQGVMTVRSLETTEEIIQTSNYESGVNQVNYSSDGELIVAGFQSGEVQVQERNSGNLITNFSGHQDQVTDVQFLAEDEKLISAGFDNTVQLWETGSGEVTNIFQEHESEITSLAISPEEEFIVSGDRDSKLITRNPDSEEILVEFSEHEKEITDIDIAPDGSLIASSSRDQTVRIWDPETGETKFVFSSHSAPVMEVAFLPRLDFFSTEPTTIVSGSSEGEIFIWQ